MNIARSRADIIITTGPAWGPTWRRSDKAILAKAFGLALVRNQAEYDNLYEYIPATAGRMTPNNFNAGPCCPEGCTVFHNNWGTAPGCAFEKDGKIVIMIPGRPRNATPCSSTAPCLI